uniref:N-acetylgalactosamine kinase-like n=1 Tax=Saccoglossus kowalevskii TaxID=10224 RepID=A0ABM0GM26_SACKO|nr:PREDICTED: N-acetylgalactosamine kinase-like [Saccoglossus kowalevskii]
MASGDQSPPVMKIPFSQKDRYDRIQEIFRSKYDCDPAFYARAPGRVNIIGEHIDYCGYSVLPMAIEQDIVIAAAPTNTGQITLVNTDPEYGQFIPKGAGLSSSSAFVCCAGLIIMYANKLKISKLNLAEICTWSERYIGTESGGMDQAISFLAEPVHAKHIEFHPLKATDVKLPNGVVFVISNSNVVMEKAASSHYNIRVAECRLAAQIIAKSKGLEWKKIRLLGDLQKVLNVSLDDMIAMVTLILHQEPYLKSEICEILEVSEADLNQMSLSDNTLHITSFKLHDRAKHVYAEANRVLRFKQICDERPPDTKMLLGNLMNESHTSCRDLYECSSPELDELTNLCMQAGAYGSRLTGAGWGGCAVSMVPASKVGEFLARVHDGYYANDPQKKAKVEESLFATQPGSGAAIYIP